MGEINQSCAPNKLFEDGSCISLDVLIEMVRAYNSENPNNKIDINENKNTLNPSKYKKILLNAINDKLKNKCTSQVCWTEQTFINKMNQAAQEELQNETFRPSGPEGRFEWLNTVNIDEVMEQYKNKYNDFEYLGTVPMDFDSINVGIKDLNFSDLYNNGKKRLGIVYNLDNHNQPGSHWVAGYFDLEKGCVYYFDSYGIRPEPRVRKLMRRIYRWIQENRGIKTPIADYNKVRHQRENSECGVYSINFILRMLKGKTFEEICNRPIHDRKINKCRNIYFANKVNVE